MTTLDTIIQLLSQSFQQIHLVEGYKNAKKRYNDTGVIIFSFLYYQQRRVIKYYTLENISYEKIQERMHIINREYELARRVTNHPQFVKVFRHDKISIGNRYVGIVMQMEYFEHTMDKYIASKKKFSVAEVRNFLFEMSDALEYIHHRISNPFAHLDIKPSNIGIRKLQNGHLQYVLMDFDVSIDLCTEKTVNLPANASSGFTPGYASPEQMRLFGTGQGKITYKSDIYSTGVIAIEMLTGVMPNGKTSNFLSLIYSIPVELRNTCAQLCDIEAEKRPVVIRNVVGSQPAKPVGSNGLLIVSAVILIVILIVALAMYFS